MRQFLTCAFVLALLCMAGCAPQYDAIGVSTTAPVLVASVVLPTVVEPTVTLQPSLSPTPRPAPSSTAPAPAPYECDQPYCVVDVIFPFAYPAPDSMHLPIDASYPFGSTQDGKRELHSGVEFQYKAGTPVLAAADGKVVFASNDKDKKLGLYNGFYGNVVIIEHRLNAAGPTYYSLYGHMLSIKTYTGKQVKAGEKIGEVGQSGAATGSHLHFEVRRGENVYLNAVNPVLFLQPFFDKIAATGSGTFVLQGVLDSQTSLLDFTLESAGLTGHQIVYGTTYDQGAHTDPVIEDLVAITELKPGRYTLKLSYNGRVHKQEIEISPGKMTIVPLALFVGT